MVGIAFGINPARQRQIRDMVRSVHNLEELTQRPFTLRLVAELIPDIEKDRLAGRPVYGVTLYRHMARRWLERDAGKHHIKPEHKIHLAAYLWGAVSVCCRPAIWKPGSMSGLRSSLI